jgi:hypothetical protein
MLYKITNRPESNYLHSIQIIEFEINFHSVYQMKSV